MLYRVNYKLKKLEVAHEGHPGIVAIKSRLLSKLWWPGINNDAERIVKLCNGFTLEVAPNSTNPLNRRGLPQDPWAKVGIDYVEPLSNGNYILIIENDFICYKKNATNI